MPRARRHARRHAIRSSCIDPVWESLYAAARAARRLARPTCSTMLQFLTIRRYLASSFAALVLLLLVLALWQ